jgi:VWFA-related protein
MMRTLIAMALASVTVLAQDPPQRTFTSRTDAVPLNVSVFDGDRVVTNLRPSDFEVTDNGVRQTITTADFDRLPVDLRLVFDTSGSISDEELKRYERMMQRVAEDLETADRGEIITFNTKLAEAAERRHPPLAVNLKRTGLDGTAFFDAGLAAMTTVGMSDRRQMTILLTDAVDNESFFDEETLFEAARRSDAVVYSVLPGNSLVGRALSVQRLDYLSTVTGGRLILKPPAYIASAITDTIKEFRQSYLLQYHVTGVPLPGWHKVQVKVKGGGYRVRARTGYYGK